jgi:hypothetical protein
MKNTWIKTMAAAVAVLGVAGIAQATPVTGNITFTGGVQLNSASSGTATEVLDWTGPGGAGNPIVLSASGSFASITPGASATFTSPWNFNSGAVNNFWTVGGFTFDLISSYIAFQGGNPAGVLVDGTGMVSGNSLTSTLISWSFSVSDPSAGTPPIFSFQAAAGSVPDGGTTAAMLGMGILGLSLCGKKLFLA